MSGYEIHYMNIANGSCGSSIHSKEEIIAIRKKEAIKAAELIGATFHDSLVGDFEIYYEPKLLARMAAIMREVAPEVLLLQSPVDYMEDHQNAARLGATAAFTMGIPNFVTDPIVKEVNQPVAIYHAQPHGNRDILGKMIIPELIVDISSVIDQKTVMLSCHQSQKEWLDRSQGMDSYLTSMKEYSKEIGAMTKHMEYAEGWRKRLHLGYCDASFSPLEDALQSYLA